jgi:hypothetical protein
MAVLIASGCSSNIVHHKKISNKILEKNKEDRSNITQQYPKWVLNPHNHFNFPVGIACSVVNGRGYQAKLHAKSYALEVARLELFKALKGEQRISAQETFREQGQNKKLDISIKRYSEGFLPKNKIVNESFVTLDGREEVCLAVNLLAQ